MWFKFCAGAYAAWLSWEVLLTGRLGMFLGGGGGGGTGSWIIGVWWCTICEVVQNALVGICAIVGSRGSRAAEAAEQ